MAAEPGRWRLERFVEHLDIWVEREQPSDDLRLILTAWVLTRFDDPYQGVQRERGFDNLWFGEVPRSRHGSGLAVACSYWIYAREGVVRCNSISTLPLPI